MIGANADTNAEQLLLLAKKLVLAASSIVGQSEAPLASMEQFSAKQIEKVPRTIQLAIKSSRLRSANFMSAYSIISKQTKRKQTHLIRTVVKKVNKTQGTSLVRQLNIQKWKVLMSSDSSAKWLNPT